MEIFLLFIHILVCFVLIVSILLQSGKGGGLAGGAFGGMGGGGGAVFGGGGSAPFFRKITTYAGVLFALTCVGLWYASRTEQDLPDTAAERLLQEQSPIPLNQGTRQQSPAEVEKTVPTRTGQ